MIPPGIITWITSGIKLNYPYHYYSHDIDGDKHFTGSVIFSRFPILDSGMIRYPRPTLPEALMHADIKVNNRIIRVYTTHLQSAQLGKSDYEKINRIKEGDDGFFFKFKDHIFKSKKRNYHPKNSDRYHTAGAWRQSIPGCFLRRPE
jgi:hypothetical protein